MFKNMFVSFAFALLLGLGLVFLSGCGKSTAAPTKDGQGTAATSCCPFSHPLTPVEKDSCCPATKTAKSTECTKKAAECCCGDDCKCCDACKTGGECKCEDCKCCKCCPKKAECCCGDDCKCCDACKTGGECKCEDCKCCKCCPKK